MIKSAFLFLLMAVFAFGMVFSIDLKYDQKTGRKFRFKNQVVFSVYHNDDFSGTEDQMNKSVLEITDITNGIGVFNGKYFNYSRDNTNDSYKLLTVYTNTFSQDEHGRMYINSSEIIPSTRSIPTLPSEPVQMFDSWKSPGEEILGDVFEAGKVYKVDVDVNYQYISNVTVKDKALAVISVDYVIQYKPGDSPDLASITGKTKNLFYWDIEYSAPYFYTEDIKLLYTAKNGETVFYDGNSASIMEEITDVTNTEKSKLMTELSNQIGSPTNGITVREINDGIIVSLGNILFDINSYHIKQDFEEKLNDLSGVLVQHPNLDIVVSGHTDNTGTNPYNTILSENRAKAISDYLSSKGVVKSRISYIGYGPTKPIADNNTSAGRTLNRRVEVKIITKE